MNFGGGKPALKKQDREKISLAFEDKIDVNFVEGACTKIAYLANVKSTTITDQTSGAELAAILMFFVEPSGKWFKAHFAFCPYFYVLCDSAYLKEVIFYLQKIYASSVKSVEAVAKEDLTLINHLSGKTQTYIKLTFKNEQDLMTVRKDLLPQVQKNKSDRKTQDAYEGWYNAGEYADGSGKNTNYSQKITDIREYDLTYQIRVQIDNEIRVSHWYQVELEGPLMKSHIHLKEKLDKAAIRVLAFDIETTKQPLRFPDVKYDQVMMISYIVDGSGFLITNRQIVGEDVSNFEYAPREDYDVGTFTVFNEPDELRLLKKFFSHIRETKPTVFTTFNGDNFDWPFIQARADHHRLKMEEEIGIFNNDQGEFSGRFASHLDCLYWVKRDAFLPQGSHGLKMVTKAKLGYDPVELDPELMVKYAKEKAQHLAEYSVSDAVATYFLYMIQIHDFIFALCTIIPTNPDDVLRRGSGTLCENLLMAEAFRGNIIFPNKQVEDHEKFYKGKLIDSETYIGGHVECLRTGVYRSDFPVEFQLDKAGYQSLIEKVPQIMDFALTIEPGHQNKAEITNYEEVRQEIESMLIAIRDKCPKLVTTPLIYHVDVGAMYPNIILTNRLQPTSIVNEQICAGCLYNKEENNCKRKLDWQWRGELFTLNKGEYERIKHQLEEDDEDETKPGQKKIQMSAANQAQAYADKLKKRVKTYCSAAHKRVHETKTETKTDTVCMRENPFYVDTVRDFRDRRYDFKRLVKTWGDKMRAAQKAGDITETENAKNRVTLYESLQLAHKIILNSFYGYVMRRGARWYSMEMAAMVTHTGGNIIMDSRSLYDKIGMPLELDTDGIWTLLPKGFPETFTFKFLSGKTFRFDFPCTMSNELIYEKYGNPQYQTLVNQKKGAFDVRHEMSIFFEIDGPYKCMLIPASTEENRMLKKRYAVFNHAGKMTEVKGFELKRRGELQIIKIFQQEVFTRFLDGSNLQECYDACGEVASRWYDILESKGEYVEDSELIDYIGEERVIGKSQEEYGSQKSAALTCAKRLSDCLGYESNGVEKGLNVKFIISRLPLNASVTERAIPTLIFDMEEQVMKKYLKKWTGDNGMTNFNLRNIIDWDYYKDRLAGTIQKIVMIPAALQNCNNPVPAIDFPEWLLRQIKIKNDKVKQRSLNQFFKPADIEDLAQKKLKFEAQAAAINKKKLDNAPIQKPELRLEECPSIDQDFGTWLKYQKSNWRSLRRQLRTDRGLVKKKTSIPGLLKGSQALMSFIRNNDDTILNSNWHILQIEQTFEPGILKVWAVTSQGFMFNVRLQVGRTVFINSKIVNTDPEFKKCEKELPRSIHRYHLYEWQSTEEHFLQKFNTLKYTSLLSDKIEGIYETKVPPKFRALMELGNQLKPIKQKIPRQEQAYGRTYRIPELQINNSETYLESDSFERIYLLHSCTDKRHLWGMFIGATHEIYFFIVNPGMKAIQTQGQISLETAFQKLLQEYGLEVDFASWQVKDQTNFMNLSSACKAIEQKLVEHKQKNKNATLVVLQSSTSQAQIPQLGLNSLANEFPVIRCPIFESDYEYPALDWLKFAARNMTYRFCEVEEWLQNQIQFSRNTAIPLCNLENTSFVIDTLFAKMLFQQKHLLWYSDSAKPDLGGHEDRNYRLFIQEDIENPQLNNKGFYRNYSVEINISQLALNTILRSESMPEFASIFNSTAINVNDSKARKDTKQPERKKQQDQDMDLDEFVTCGPAFLRLKKLVGLWYFDKKQGQSYADPLLMELYSWLSNSNTKLYDPMLHRMIHKMMTKNFLWLVQKFKELRCHVIHGDFQKIILTTEKRNYEEASTHIDFVLNQIKKEDAFQELDLTPGEFWQILLYKDPFNYAGIPESNPDKMSVRFNVSDFLPEAIRNKFKMTIMRFVTEVFKENRKLDGLDENQREQSPQKVKKDEIVDYMEIVDDVSKERDHAFICKLISEHFSQRVLSTLTEIMDERKKAMQDMAGLDSESELDEEGQENSQIDQHDYKEQRKLREQERIQKELQKWEFPDKIGSYNGYSVPALEFGKMLCHHVFGLDPAFQQQANVLFRNCLTILRFKEFSQDVQSGKEPSLTLVIPDVICSNCQTIIDLDICRAQQIYTDPVNEVAAPVWRCGSCEEALNKDQIERRLLEILNKRMINYQLQDLKCKSCKMISNSIVKRYCECTGKLNQTVGFELPEKLLNQNLLNQMTDIRLVIRLMRNFGERHEMRMLQAAAENLLEMLPAFN